MCPPTFASCVKPWRFFGRRTRVPVGSVGGECTVVVWLNAGIDSGSISIFAAGGSELVSLLDDVESGCDAISKLVSTGVTKKAAALTQLRASLKGGKLPPGCD